MSISIIENKIINKSIYITSNELFNDDIVLSQLFELSEKNGMCDIPPLDIPLILPINVFEEKSNLTYLSINIIKHSLRALNNKISYDILFSDVFSIDSTIQIDIEYLFDHHNNVILYMIKNISFVNNIILKKYYIGCDEKSLTYLNVIFSSEEFKIKMKELKYSEDFKEDLYDIIKYGNKLIISDALTFIICEDFAKHKYCNTINILIKFKDNLVICANIEYVIGGGYIL